MDKNIILIGMPGSGKSTIGVQLAKELGLNFVDSDLVIQSNQGTTLQNILDAKGYKVLRTIEEQELLVLTLNKEVLATGGSAVYSDKAMQHLKQQGILVYLKVSFEEMKRRINNEGSRGIARPPGHTLEDIYNERLPLYEQYADITIDNNKNISIETIAKQLL